MVIIGTQFEYKRQLYRIPKLKQFFLVFVFFKFQNENLFVYHWQFVLYFLLKLTFFDFYSIYTVHFTRLQIFRRLKAVWSDESFGSHLWYWIFNW